MQGKEFLLVGAHRQTSCQSSSLLALIFNLFCFSASHDFLQGYGAWEEVINGRLQASHSASFRPSNY
uniref:Uncharacterized protein n=1 Tax=Setaria italica TaxID=4555 RepID=K4AHQ9_SETIT